AGGVDGIRTGPYFYVDRKYHVPCISDEKKQGSADKKSIDHLRSFPFLDDVISAEITKQNLRQRTKKANQYFRIKGDRLPVYSFSMINMMFAKQGNVDFCSKPAFQTKRIGRIACYSENPISQ